VTAAEPPSGAAEAADGATRPLRAGDLAELKGVDMQNLWAPWRLAYVSRPREGAGCFLCQAASGDGPDRERLVVARGTACFCLLNRFPYSNGHLMIALQRHESDLGAFSREEAAETWRMIVAARDVLAKVVGAQGFNVGWNLGACAGAGVDDHLHAHVVPRWTGDTNFMPVLADVKVIPQALEELWRKIAAAWPREDDRKC
jgi:ATP adenylyltransferase